MLKASLLGSLFWVALGLYESSNTHVKLLNTAREFQALKSSNNPAIVEFFSDRCGHCQAFAPEYEKAAEYLRGIVPVYAASDPEVVGLETIKGVPTVMYYADGKAEEYEGPRTAKDVANFALAKLRVTVNARTGGSAGNGSQKSKRSKASPPGRVVELSSDDFDEVIMADTQNVWFVKFYAPWCGHCKALAPTWDEMAKELEGKVKVAKVNADRDKTLAARFQVQGFPTLILFPAGKKTTASAVRYQQGRELPELTRFALKYAERAIKAIQLTSQSQYDELCSEKLCFVSFLPHILDSNAQERKGYLRTLKQLAISKAGLPINYLWMEASNSLDLERALRLEFGWPATILINKAKGFYATHRGGFKLSDLESFVDRVATGRLNGDVLPSSLPPIPQMEKWDGKDAPQRDEL